MFIRRSHKSNCAVKMAMIIPQEETQAIGLSRLKGFKPTRIGRMALQGREEGFNKGVIRGGTEKKVWGQIFILDKEKEIGAPHSKFKYPVVFWVSGLHLNKLKATALRRK